MRNPFLEKLSTKELLKVALENNTLRSAALKLAERKLYRIMMEEKPDIIPERVREDRYLVARNLLRLMNRFMKKEKSSSAVRRRVIEVAVENAAMKDRSKFEIHNEKYGCDPPYFVVISPGQGCNLRCKGCYAGSIDKPANLDYDVVSRIIDEKQELWGSHFTVISGGEPLMYRSNGKGILDLFTEHQNDIFLMYTNGTLIDEKAAEKIAELGNVLPAISVEGFREETDERRGEGTYEKILQAFENLREAGAPFGISVTATKNNAEAVPIPTRSSICILIDGGANMSCKPTNLLQFAIMGKVYAEKILQRREPKVSLLNVGEEEGKGNKLAKEAYKMLSGTPLNFVGNIEGKDMFNSDVDVVVCDGFTGNVSMKIVEGLAEALFSLLENSEKATLIETIKRNFDYSEYGGAPLLGINGTCIISHGRSKDYAIKNAIRVASELVSLEINHSIQEEIQQYGPLYR